MVRISHPRRRIRESVSIFVRIQKDIRTIVPISTGRIVSGKRTGDLGDGE